MIRPSTRARSVARAQAALGLAGVLLAQTLLVVPVVARSTGEAAAAQATEAAVPGAAPQPRETMDPVASAEDARGTSPHYEQAMEHARDRINFVPGGRVTVGFSPRAGDRWAVGGAAPRPLPAGRATGRAMAASPQGSRWTADPAGTATPAPDATPAPSATATPAPSEVPPPTPDPTAPVDAPSLDPADVESATSTAAKSGTSDTASDVAATAMTRQVFGFLPYWELSKSDTVLDYNVLTTIAYFSVGADNAGNLLKRNSDGSLTTGWAGWTSTKMTDVINRAHANGTRVVLTLTSFAWTSSQTTNQKAILGSATARTNLARQAAAAVRDRGADGINLDFEPIASGYDDEFTALVRAVRVELDRIAPGYQLTFDTTGFIGNYPLEAATAPGGADAIFIMGYDYRVAGSATSGSIDPLTGTSYDITDTIKAYVARVPASKLILGVPYYGRVWSTSSDAPRATNISGTKNGTSSSVIYTSAVELAAKNGRRWDSVESSPYVAYLRENCTTTYGCVTSWRQVWYDDAASLKLRYDLVNQYGLQGAGIWALGYDDTRTELNAALAEKFGGTVAPPPPAEPPPPPPPAATAPVVGVQYMGWRQRDAGFTVRWTGTDDGAIDTYDVQVSVDGGTFTWWLSRTKKTSEVYLGQSGRAYAFRVRATDTEGNVSAWNVSATWKPKYTLEVGGFAGVQIDGLSMRATPSTSATRLGGLPIGRIIALVDGPVAAEGQTWWKAVGPLAEWRPVTAVQTFWVAQGSSTTPYLRGTRGPNVTVVDAVLRDLQVGADTTGTTDADARTFSPNGDGRRDRMTIRWTNALALDALDLRVYRTDGAFVGSVPLRNLGAGEQRFDWDGVVGSGRAADGAYILALWATDAGQIYTAPSRQPVTAWQLARYGITVDTTPPPVSRITANPAAISPNGDATAERVTVTMNSPSATQWGFRVAPVSGTGAGAPIREGIGTGSSSPIAWTWDGRTAAGAMAPDGPYLVSLWATDGAGNRNTRSADVAVDTRAATVTARASLPGFSPNADGVQDTVSLSWSSDEATTGTVTVMRGSAIVRMWSATTTGTVVWDGRDAAGVLMPDAAYDVVADLVDAAGNHATARARFAIDRTATRLTWSPSIFFPHDADALAPTAAFTFDLSRQATTSLRLYALDGTPARTAWTDRVLAAGTHRFTWDGTAATGIRVPRGWYRAILTATSSLSTTRVSKLVLVDAYTVTLSNAQPTAGETLTVRIRTAEPLAAAPSVTFTQSGRTGVTKTASRASSIVYVATFTVASGAPGPATISISGRDTGGRINSQVTPLTVR